MSAVLRYQATKGRRATAFVPSLWCSLANTSLAQFYQSRFCRIIMYSMEFPPDALSGRQQGAPSAAFGSPTQRKSYMNGHARLLSLFQGASVYMRFSTPERPIISLGSFVSSTLPLTECWMAFGHTANSCIPSNSSIFYQNWSLLWLIRTARNFNSF